MSALNKIVPFCTTTGNMYSDADYNGGVQDASRQAGNVPGTADDLLVNKALHQATLLAAGIGQFVIDRVPGGSNVTDALTAAQISTAIQAAVTTMLPSPIPAGSKMWFYQDTAPTGWTIVSSCADGLLAVKGGLNAYNVAGGQQVGTWTQTGHTHTGPNHNHTTSGHVHNVTVPIGNTWNEFGCSDGTWDAGVNDNYGKLVTVHNRTVVDQTYHATKTPIVPSALGGAGTTGYDGTEATGSSATSNVWRPLANVGIICSKN